MTTLDTWVPTNTFAARLTLVRKELNLNGVAFAERCGFDPGTLNNWEHGRVPRNLAAVVEVIAQATGVNREWLMWGGPLQTADGKAAENTCFMGTDQMVGSVEIDLTRPFPHVVPVECEGQFQLPLPDSRTYVLNSEHALMDRAA